MPNPLTALATEVVQSGVSIIPLRLDGSKAPAIASWKEYQTRLPTDEELQSWYRSKAGIGLVGGIVSGGLEILDFDDGSLFEPWRKSIESIAVRLPVVETPSGGYHVFYRCEVISGNQKIAVDPNREKQTLIETRGDGGYVCGVGSPIGIHRDGLYVQTMGPVLPEIPTISVVDRKQLWKAARAFDKSESLKSFLPKPKVEQKKHEGDTPWDDFNRRATWDQILKGWKQQSETDWTRPGKSNGTSASVRKAAGSDVEVLVVFSSNAGPIAPSNSDHRTLSKFEAFKQLNYGGDGRAAAKAALTLGFGGSH